MPFAVIEEIVQERCRWYRKWTWNDATQPYTPDAEPLSDRLDLSRKGPALRPGHGASPCVERKTSRAAVCRAAAPRLCLQTALNAVK